MAQLKQAINTYRVTLRPYRGWRFSPTATNLMFDAWMYCHLADGNPLRIFFVEGEPPPGFVTDSGHWYTFVAQEQYIQYLDLLRNEKPVFAELDDESGVFGITTSAEPVGEGPGEPT